MPRLYTIWFVPAALTLFSLRATTALASTPTTYPFSANYEVLVTANDITPNQEQTFISGSSTDAPYGLTKVNGLSYAQTDFTTGLFSFNTDPATFGLQNEPSGFITFFDSGSDKLFGTQSGSGVIDFTTLTVSSFGTVTITGGEGRFKGATGVLSFSQVQPLSLVPDVALMGQVVVNGSFQTVPEPETNTALVGMGMIGAVSCYADIALDELSERILT